MKYSTLFGPKLHFQNLSSKSSSWPYFEHLSHYIGKKRKIKNALGEKMIIGKRFQIDEKIGSGAHGHVFSGVDLRNCTFIAMKIVPQEQLSTSKFNQEIFVRLIRVLMVLDIEISSHLGLGVKDFQSSSIRANVRISTTLSCKCWVIHSNLCPGW